MKYLLGFLCGLIVATAVGSWAECCGGFNVPYDTQLEMDRREMNRDLYAPLPLTTLPDRSLPCRYGDR